MDTICFERRSSLRRSPSFVIGLSFSPIGERREIWGSINNVSSGGIGISAVFRLPPKTVVDITMAKKPQNSAWEIENLVGRICWCLPDPVVRESFNLGIESADLHWLY